MSLLSPKLKKDVVRICRSSRIDVNHVAKAQGTMLSATDEAAESEEGC